MTRSHLAQRHHVGGNGVDGITPEQMHIGMTGRDLPGLTRAATQIEARLMLGARRHARALEHMEAPIEVHRRGTAPERLHDGDVLVHLRVAVFLGQPDAVLQGFVIALPGNQVDRHAPARKLVHRADHAGEQHRIDIARSGRDQHLDGAGAGQHHRRADVGIPAGRRHRHQQIFEACSLGSPGDLLEEVHRGRHHAVATAVGDGVAGGGQKPAEFEGSQAGGHDQST